MASQVGHDSKKADIESFGVGNRESKADKLFLIIESKKEEAAQVDSVNEEVTLDLGDELEIEIEE